jgi:UDP-glucose 4-epimerase
VSCCSLRLFNVYGPGQRGDTEYGAVVPRFVAAVRGDVEAIVYGDGKQIRSFVHIDDVVRAFLLALDSDVTGPLNIAGNGLSVLGLLDVLGDIRGRPVRRRHEAPRRGDIRTSIGVSARAWDALRWAPRILLSDGLRGLLGDEGGAVVG